MSKTKEIEQYEVGYGRPPKSGQFKKGISGNPSGRPKKPSDFASEISQELGSKVIIHENGQRKAIRKLVGLRRQLVNKALSGNLQATRMVIALNQQAEQSAAGQQQNSPNVPDYRTVRPEDLTDEQLELMIRKSREYATLKDDPEFIALAKKDSKKAKN